MIDILVVIPAAIDNGELVYLVEAVRSARHDNVLIYVIVDGQAPKELDTALPAGDGLIVGQSAERNGPGWARNQGLMFAEQNGIPYVLPLDADDILYAGAIDILLNVARADAIWIGDVVMDSGIVKQQLPTAGGVLTGKSIPVVTALYPTHLLAEAGGWREDMAGLEDVELWVRLLRTGARVSKVDAPMMRYRQRPGSRRVTMGDGPWHHLRALHADLWHILHTPKYAPLATKSMLADPVLLLYVGRNKHPFGLKGPATGLRYQVKPDEGVMVERTDVPRIMSEYRDLFAIAPEMPANEPPADRVAAWKTLADDLEADDGPR